MISIHPFHKFERRINVPNINDLPTELVEHYNNLCRYRQSGQVLEAGKDWLDKEIFDIETFLQGRKNRYEAR